MQNNINDAFGFTFADEADISAPKAQEAKDNSEKLLQMRIMIQSLLDNLKLNPDKNYIQWDGVKRIAQINDFIAKLDAIYPIPHK